MPAARCHGVTIKLDFCLSNQVVFLCKPILMSWPSTTLACAVAAGSVNIPFDKLRGRIAEVEQLLDSSSAGSPRRCSQPQLVVLCRRGNDSQACACLYPGDRAHMHPCPGLACITPLHVRQLVLLQVAVQWLAEAGISAVDLLDGLSACGRVQNSAFPTY